MFSLCIFFYAQIRRPLYNGSLSSLETADNEDSETEFYLENETNYNSVISTLKIPTGSPTMAQALHPERNRIDSGNLVSELYEAKLDIRSLQDHLQNLVAENVFIRRKLYKIRRHYNTLKHNVDCLNPNESYLKYRNALI